MFRFPPLRDPRVALFGLTLFNHANPGLEKQLEIFANILEATRNSLSAIRSEMHNFESSMFSITAPKTEFTTQPVHETVQQDAAISYTNPNYTQPASQVQQPYTTVQTMDIKDERENQVKDQLERFIRQNPDKMNEFLDDLERLIRKYR
ncbi:hypothetical protein [Desulforamulus putei]|uniref:Uncharacterized protein n=1 Tax=Desulforamulus putei DSM 12395 TaxID=1121429 RepID=A0A1M4YB56_9FIRM|nr:hypothetical protein [Desulforamulus putei]SHF02846.1 hypothetical protein SAMN02745133_01661 [Desulforamulus putei DSM 12395]